MAQSCNERGSPNGAERTASPPLPHVADSSASTSDRAIFGEFREVMRQSRDCAAAVASEMSARIPLEPSRMASTPIDESSAFDHALALTPAPEPVLPVPIAATVEAESPHLALVTWIALIVSTMCWAAVGPAFKWIMTRWQVRAACAGAWRGQSMLLTVLPLTAHEWYRASAAERASWWVLVPDEAESPLADESVRLACCRPGPIAPRPVHVGYYLCAISAVWALNLTLWVQSLSFTTTVRSSLFGSIYPLIIMVYLRVARGVRHSAGEFVGVVVSLLGMGLAFLDDGADAALAANLDGVSMLIGDLMSIATAFMLSGFILLGGRARTVLPIFMYTTLSTFGHAVLIALLSIGLEGSTIGFASPGAAHTSVFGWLSAEYFPTMLAFGFAVGLVGLLGFNFCIKYMDPVIFSTVQLIEPAITAWMAWASGLEGVPELWTIVGGCIVIAGIVLVVVYEHRRNKSEELLLAEMAAERLRHESVSTPVPVSQSFDADLVEFAAHDFGDGSH